MHVALSWRAALQAGLALEPCELGAGWGCSGSVEHKGRKAARRAEAWSRLHIIWLCNVACLWVFGWLQWEKEEVHVQLHDRTAVRLGQSLYTFVCCCSTLRNTDVPS